MSSAAPPKPRQNLIWSTPQALFDVLHSFFKFKVDLCADPGNAKLPKYFDRRESLSLPWKEDGFLNPPFGRGIELWVAKAREDANEYHAVHVCIVPGRTNPPWWHQTILRSSELWFLEKKQAFIETNGKAGVPPWGVCIAIFHHGTEPSPDSAGPIVKSWNWRSGKPPKNSSVVPREGR